MVLFNDQRTRESYLIGMMRTNYLKRLESSVHSFEISIDRTIKKIDDLLQKIDHFEGNFDDIQIPICSRIKATKKRRNSSNS